MYSYMTLYDGTVDGRSVAESGISSMIIVFRLVGHLH